MSINRIEVFLADKQASLDPFCDDLAAWSLRLVWTMLDHERPGCTIFCSRRIAEAASIRQASINLVENGVNCRLKTNSPVRLLLVARERYCV